MPCKGLFCASSDERSHGKFAVVLARTENFVWVLEERRICAKIGRNPFENAKNVNDREEDRQQQQIGDAGEKQGRYPVPHVTQQVFGKSPVVFVPTAQQAGEQSDNDRDVIGGIFDPFAHVGPSERDDGQPRQVIERAQPAFCEPFVAEKSQQQYDRSGQQLFAAIGKNVVLGQHSDDEQVRRNGHFDRSTAQRDEIFGEESPYFRLDFHGA